MNTHLWQRCIGIGLVTIIVVVAILAPWIAPYDPNISSADVLSLPSANHWFGTDHLGRDAYSRLVFGTRASLLIGLCATAISMAIGVPIGMLSGYAGGKFDTFVVQIIDICISLPAIIMALIITSVIGVSVVNLIIILGLLKWPIIARIVRGQVRTLRDQAFVEAARAVGCNVPRILFRHIGPNIIRVIAAQFSIVTSSARFTAASLSCLGMGLPPPTADWGSMVQSGFDYLFFNPLLSLAPGAAVTFTLMSFYLIGQTFQQRE
jgi:peptide/nickel transport system permease protein